MRKFTVSALVLWAAFVISTLAPSGAASAASLDSRVPTTALSATSPTTPSPVNDRVAPAPGSNAAAWQTYAAQQRTLAENGTLELEGLPSNCTLLEYWTTPVTLTPVGAPISITLDGMDEHFRCAVPGVATGTANSGTTAPGLPPCPTSGQTCGASVSSGYVPSDAATNGKAA